MLYKKVHRQYVREWREGRKFMYCGFVHKVYKGPFFLTLRQIWIERGRGARGSSLYLCILSESGKMLDKNDLTWLEN